MVSKLQSDFLFKVLFTENGSDCLYLLTSLLGKVVVVQMASACRVEVEEKMH